MIRQSILCMAVLAASVQAGEAGRIVFVTGNATSGNQPLQTGQVIAEGAELATGADGYVYLKTVDNGFLILRPASRAKIVAYHIDSQNPANTRIKLSLMSGVARSISGEAVKKARQNFRFNTPVAAIGVRGTDFTVFTDAETSRVAVISGGIVVSGFAGNCGPEGSGPCEGGASHELSASQVGQLLQVRRGQAAPQLLNGSVLPADVTAPPRADEPKSAANGGQGIVLASNDVSLDPQKNASLVVHTPVPTPVPTPTPTPTPIPTPTPTPVPTPVPTPTPTPTPPLVPPELQRQVVWGRWQPVLDRAAKIDFVAERAKGSELIETFGSYVLFRSKGTDLQLPQSGNVGFVLRDSDASVMDQKTRVVTSATLENGKLDVDFGKKTFTTSFDLLNLNQRFQLSGTGTLAKDGTFSGSGQFQAPGTLSVGGAFGPDNGSTAAYVFKSVLPDGVWNRVATGATYWGK